MVIRYYLFDWQSVLKESGDILVEKGKQSMEFLEPIYIQNSGSIVGKKEGEGPLGLLFDSIGSDDMFGETTWEGAESTLQKEAIYLALTKANLSIEDIRFLFAGDLLGQSIATSYAMKSYDVPVFGVYGACSTCGECLSLGAMSISGGFADKVMCVTSSHFASAEKEFRFPLAYGNQRPLSASWTVTGSAAFILSKTIGNKSRACIKGATVGKIVDFGLKDSMNMGACMAPAAAEIIEVHLQDFQRDIEYYDKIITGDLGEVGKTVLLDLLDKKGYDISQRHMDCGIEIFDGNTQDTHAGGSGCGCCAVTLSAYILKQLEEKNWKRVLFVPTGALMNKTSFNEGKTVPGIAHAIILEHIAK